jgi:hypothetical protein
MMLGNGGGFVKQALESFEKNRTLRKEAVKGAIKRNNFKTKSEGSLTKNDPEMNATDREVLIRSVRRRFAIEVITTVVLSAALLFVILYFIVPRLNTKLF